MKNNQFIYHFFNTDPFHTHMKLLSRVPPNSKVLEIGCATGYFTQKLIGKGCSVTAIEIDKQSAAVAKKIAKAKIINIDIHKIVQVIKQSNKFDIIILADVLEHLPDPKEILLKIKKYLKPDGHILISVPNIANFAIRLKLFFLGEFEYEDYGIMDKTHLYFFTNSTSQKMLEAAGLTINNFDIVAGFEASKIYRSTIGAVTYRLLPLRYLEYYLAKLFPSLFALEFIYEAKIK